MGVGTLPYNDLIFPKRCFCLRGIIFSILKSQHLNAFAIDTRIKTGEWYTELGFGGCRGTGGKPQRDG